MNSILKIVAALAIFVLVVLAGGFIWVKSTVDAKLAGRIEVHAVAFAVPYPLSQAERDELLRTQGAEADLDARAGQRALARGRHLVEARYACVECHGKDFSGGVMVDDPAIGRILGPNITSGKGGVVSEYTASDWDHIVRHGVRRDGHPATMPAVDFQLMSDQELADIITYIGSVPPVDNEVPPVTLGPLGTFLMAVGQFPLAAEMIGDHHRTHPTHPPASDDTLAFGRHLAGICSGCHHADFRGGPIPAAPPEWPPSANLTPHADGLQGWTFEQFETSMREGLLPDGSEVRLPMSLITPYAQRMTDTEVRALWAYLSSLEAAPGRE